MMKWRLNARGFSMIEVMIAGGISVVILAGVLTLLNYYTDNLYDMQMRSGLQSVRAYVLQNINRPDAWVLTYRYGEDYGYFKYALDPTTNPYPAQSVIDALPIPPSFVPAVAAPNSDLRSLIPADDGIPFNLFDRYLKAGASIDKSVLNPEATVPPTANKIVNTLSGNYGFTTRGKPCTNFPNVNCPIRLVLTWKLLNVGGDPVPNGSYLAYGFAEISIFPTSPFPNGTAVYGFVGTAPAQVRVNGTFFYNKTGGTTAAAYERLRQYDFSVIKEVP